MCAADTADLNYVCSKSAHDSKNSRFSVWRLTCFVQNSFCITLIPTTKLQIWLPTSFLTSKRMTESCLIPRIRDPSTRLDFCCCWLFSCTSFLKCSYVAGSRKVFASRHLRSFLIYLLWKNYLLLPRPILIWSLCVFLLTLICQPVEFPPRFLSDKA